MPKKKITISEVNKKHLKIIGYLLVSWGASLLLAYIMKNENLVGLAPAINYIMYVVEKELKGEGYMKALK